MGLTKMITMITGKNKNIRKITDISVDYLTNESTFEIGVFNKNGDIISFESNDRAYKVTYNNTNQGLEIITKYIKGDFEDTKEIRYNNKNIEIYSGDKLIEKHIYDHKDNIEEVFKNDKLCKVIKYNDKGLIEYIDYYTDDCNDISSEYYYYDDKNHIVKIQSSFSSANYVYNNKGDLIESYIEYYHNKVRKTIDTCIYEKDSIITIDHIENYKKVSNLNKDGFIQEVIKIKDDKIINKRLVSYEYYE